MTETAWPRLAAELGVTYQAGDFWEPEALLIPIPPWTIRVTLERSQPTLYTRLEAPLAPLAPAFAFRLERVGLWRGGAAQLTEGFTPFADFDAAYYAQARDREGLLALLDCDGYRAALLAAPPLALECDGTQLGCLAAGAVTDTVVLLRLIEIVAETLQRLALQERRRDRPDERRT